MRSTRRALALTVLFLGVDGKGVRNRFRMFSRKRFLTPFLTQRASQESLPPPQHKSIWQGNSYKLKRVNGVEWHPGVRICNAQCTTIKQ